MGGGSSSPRNYQGCSINAKYRNGAPACAADEVVGCFSVVDASTGAATEAPGLLYRLVDHRAHRWYFYNDTKDLTMIVKGFFGPHSNLRALGMTQMWREIPSGLLIAELVVSPLQTAAYVEGDVVNGFDLHYKAARSQ